MNIHQSISNQIDSPESTSTVKLDDPNLKGINQLDIPFVNRMIAEMKSVKNLKDLSFVIKNNASLKKRLEAATNKDNFIKIVAQLGKEEGVTFTQNEIKKIPGSWDALEISDLIAVFFKLSKDGLGDFLNKIKKTPSLLKEINKDIKNTNGKLVDSLKKAGDSRGYSFTKKELEGVLKRTENNGNPANNTRKSIIIGKIWS